MIIELYENMSNYLNTKEGQILTAIVSLGLGIISYAYLYIRGKKHRAFSDEDFDSGKLLDDLYNKTLEYPISLSSGFYERLKPVNIDVGEYYGWILRRKNENVAIASCAVKYDKGFYGYIQILTFKDEIYIDMDNGIGKAYNHERYIGAVDLNKKKIIDKNGKEMKIVYRFWYMKIMDSERVVAKFRSNSFLGYLKIYNIDYELILAAYFTVFSTRRCLNCRRY